MDKASLIEAVNGHIDNKVITPRVLRQWGDKVGAVSVVGTACKNIFNAYKYSLSSANYASRKIIDVNTIDARFSATWSRFTLVLTGLKHNTTYTLSAYIDKSAYSTSTSSGFYSVSGYQNTAMRKDSGKVYYTFTTGDSSEFNIQFYGNWSGTTYIGNVIYKELQLEEGSTCSEYEVPTFPSLSAKDSSGNYQTVPYVAGVASKNLLYTPYIVQNKLKVKATKDDYYIETDYSCFLEEGKTYTVSFKSDANAGSTSGTDTVQLWLLLNKNYDIRWSIYQKEQTFTCTKTGRYFLRYDINKTGMEHSFWDFQVEEGTSASDYEDALLPRLFASQSDGNFVPVPYIYGRVSKNLVVSHTSTGNTGQYSSALKINTWLKPDTTYILSFDGVHSKRFYLNEQVTVEATYFDSSSSGRTSIKFRTLPSIVQEVAGPYNWTILKNAVAFTSANVFTNVMLEESNMVTDYEPYFSPITYLQDSNGLQHKMPVVFSKISSNLYDYSKVAPGCYIINDPQTINKSSAYVFCGYIPVKPNTTYTRSDVGTTTNVFMNFGKVKIGSAEGTTFTTPDDCCYVGFNMPVAKYNDGSYKKFMMNEGPKLMSYEPYFEPTICISDDKGSVREFGLNDTKNEDYFCCGSIYDFQTYLTTNAVPGATAKLFHLSLNGLGASAFVQKTSNVYQSFIYISYSGNAAHYKCINGAWSVTNLY